MKKVRYSLMQRITFFIVTIIFVFVIVNIYKNLNPADYIFNILFVCMSLKLIAFTSLATAYYIHWRIDFNNEHFIFYRLFQKPVTIKYSDIERLSIRDTHYRDCIHNDITFYMTDNKISVPRISIPTNAENYDEFFNLLMIKTE